MVLSLFPVMAIVLGNLSPSPGLTVSRCCEAVSCAVIMLVLYWIIPSLGLLMRVQYIGWYCWTFIAALLVEILLEARLCAYLGVS